MYRKQDWATLLRQLGGQLDLLARSPFVWGDAEAEKRLRVMLRASDMAVLDKAMDDLADYLTGKRDFHVALEARRKGLPVPAPSRPLGGTRLGLAQTRHIAAVGPSGDDFVLGTSTATPDSFDRRGRLRL
jgi:hypothetical protein